VKEESYAVQSFVENCLIRVCQFVSPARRWLVQRVITLSYGYVSLHIYLHYLHVIATCEAHYYTTKSLLLKKLQSVYTLRRHTLVGYYPTGVVPRVLRNSKESTVPGVNTLYTETVVLAGPKFLFRSSVTS